MTPSPFKAIKPVTTLIIGSVFMCGNSAELVAADNAKRI
jgi:hypothetical protein